MLLNKYEHFGVIKNDAFAEELLFKIEKNFANFSSLQDKAFPLLHQTVELVNSHNLQVAELA